MSHRLRTSRVVFRCGAKAQFWAIYVALRLLGTHQARSEFPDLDHNFCRVLSGFGA